MRNSQVIDSRISEILALMSDIEQATKRVRRPIITRAELDKGLDSSYKGSKQVMEVAMTPLMKNALIKYGDFKEGDKRRLQVNDPQTKAEKAIVANIKQLLLRFNGSKDSFDDNLPLYSVEHYNVQCHQNFKENLRDIQPGQALARQKLVKAYSEPTKQDIKYWKSKILSDHVLQRAICIVLDQMPSVRASDHLKEINLPFMNKHSGVGFKWWQNDRTISEDGRTYAEVCMDVATQLFNLPQDKWFDEWLKWNVSTEYGRNQRGKGRLLIATARVLNLLLNSLEAVEIKAYKEKSPLFIGYGDDEHLKKALITVGDYCERNGLKCSNEDYDTYDLTVSSGLLALIGAMSIYKSNGSRSKTIALIRAVAAQRTLLIDGLGNKLLDIYGRVFSGFIDTNRGGGLCNAVAMTYQCMKQDKDYSKIVYDAPYYMFVMGDDNLHVYKHLDRGELSKGMKEDFGMEIKESKYEFGPMFLQYRVFQDPQTKEKVMAYAWPRVVRSMLMKEESKGLGPVGWTIAWYQQLFKLIEYKQAFSIAVNLLIPFDSNKFYKDTPTDQLIKMLNDEDNQAMSKAKTEAQKRKVSKTADKLYDGDPSKARFLSVEGELNKGVLERVQDMIKEVYDPTFYHKYGLR